jgi:hypothetical protein
MICRMVLDFSGFLCDNLCEEAPKRRRKTSIKYCFTEWIWIKSLWTGQSIGLPFDRREGHYQKEISFR